MSGLCARCGYARRNQARPLSQSTLHLCTIAARLKAQGTQLLVVDQHIDTSTPTGQFTFHMLAAMAEFETALRKERQTEGIAAAKRRGVRFGRAKTLTPVQVLELRQHRQQGVLIRELMAEYGLKKAAIYRYLKQAQPATEAEAADEQRLLLKPITESRTENACVWPSASSLHDHARLGNI